MSSQYVDFQNALAMAIASGIGGDGEMMTQDTIWSGDYQLTSSYVDLVDENIVLKYDILEIRLGNYTQMFTVKQLKESPEIRTDFVVNNSNHVVASFKFADKKLKVALDSGTYQQYAHLTKIYGIKFTGTKSIDYSTAEQVVGKYLGETLYQKTIIQTLNWTSSTTSPTIAHGVSGFKKLVAYDIMIGGYTLPYMSSANSAPRTFLYTADGTNLNFKNVDNWTGYELNCTIQYTKN